jgi:hypothetical protein
MATTKEIEISYGMTINTGNFNSERVDLSMRVTLEPGDEEDQVANEYLAYLRDKCGEVRAELLTKEHG